MPLDQGPITLVDPAIAQLGMNVCQRAAPFGQKQYTGSLPVQPVYKFEEGLLRTFVA